ncbi:hypothetical protein LRS13_24480 [Svornostia abyssi]|uniref:Universal stress protein n=1 Tax=Svornostia abyssi TaxID=2898438 RepID=A0ABY5PGG6_9ACTN|nr:hypothetical protein LRS13_24480 [Parviterribacteraceae bacterium J379]
MNSLGPARILILAHRTAATPVLLDAVRLRAEEGACEFTLLVPNVPLALRRMEDPEGGADSEAQMILDLALPLLEDACGQPVTGLVGDPNPLSAVADAINRHGPYDEVILSTLPRRVSRWLRTNLPSKIAGLGLPVTTVTAAGRRIPVPDPR